MNSERKRVTVHFRFEIRKLWNFVSCITFPIHAFKVAASALWLMFLKCWVYFNKYIKNCKARDNEKLTKLMNNMELLIVLDQQIIRQVKCLMQFCDLSKMGQITSQPTGSVIAGAFLAKWFHPNTSKHEIEFDMQYNIDYKNAFQLSDKIEAVTDKPEFLRIFSPFGNLNTAPFNALSVKETLRRADKMLPSATSYDVKVSSFEEFPSASNLTLTTKITVHYKHKIKGTIDSYFDMSRDEVIAYHNAPWPEVATDFCSRAMRKKTNIQPYWPSNAQRQQIVELGCDLVPKPSLGGNTYNEWRYSFAAAENQLMNWLSANQRRSYFLIKIIFYKHVIPVDNDNIRSYWAKTVMYWMAEEYPSSDEIWSDENVVLSLIIFLEEFLDMIENWSLPHYFIQSSSLLPQLDAYHSSLRNRMTGKLKDIIRNAEAFLPVPEDFENVRIQITSHMEFLHDSSKTIYEFVAILDCSSNTLRHYVFNEFHASRVFADLTLIDIFEKRQPVDMEVELTIANYIHKDILSKLCSYFSQDKTDRKYQSKCYNHMQKWRAWQVMLCVARDFDKFNDSWKLHDRTWLTRDMAEILERVDYRESEWLLDQEKVLFRAFVHILTNWDQFISLK